MAKIKIGWAEVDITPEKGKKISLAGQFFERISEYVEKTKHGEQNAGKDPRKKEEHRCAQHKSGVQKPLYFL